MTQGPDPAQREHRHPPRVFPPSVFPLLHLVKARERFGKRVIKGRTGKLCEALARELDVVIVESIAEIGEERGGKMFATSVVYAPMGDGTGRWRGCLREKWRYRLVMGYEESSFLRGSADKKLSCS